MLENAMTQTQTTLGETMGISSLPTAVETVSVTAHDVMSNENVKYALVGGAGFIAGLGAAKLYSWWKARK